MKRSRFASGDLPHRGHAPTTIEAGQVWKITRGTDETIRIGLKNGHVLIVGNRLAIHPDNGSTSYGWGVELANPAAYPSFAEFLNGRQPSPLRAHYEYIFSEEEIYGLCDFIV